MDTSEAERELEELETRIERLRGLYEQHFMGLEKLEPLIPRKDVERRIWVLRREQLRNTGLRFKFQMLIQRFNTFQQYWGRILREIENGTYRRDIMRAAKRFGEKDALTILGKRRAKRYTDLAAAQEARRGGVSKEAAVEELPDEYLEEEPVEDEYLGDDDLEDVSELAPVVQAAPVAKVAQDVQVAQSARAANDDLDDDDDAPTPVPLRLRNIPAALASAPVAPLPGTETLRAAVMAPQSPAAPEVKLPVEKPPFASPLARPSDPEAAKRRVAELAAQGRSQRGEGAGAGSLTGPLELDLDFDGPRTSKKSTKPPPRRASSAKMGAVRSSPTPAAGVASTKVPSAGPSPRKPSNRNLRVRAFIAQPPVRARPSAPSEADSPPPPAAATSLAPPPPPPPEHSPGAASATRVQERPQPTVPRDRSPAAPDSGLEEKRLRQIYAKYIETKRSVNEPTAGITFEKLAESLRVQAAKLRESHAARSVDYDVVVKNGKTLLKPILK